MKENKNKVILIIVIILLVIALGIGAYKIFAKKEDKNKNVNPQNNENSQILPTKEEIEKAQPTELVEYGINSIPSADELTKDSKKFFKDLLNAYQGFNGKHQIGIIVSNEHTNYNTLLKKYKDDEYSKNIFLEVQKYITSNNDYLKQIKVINPQKSPLVYVVDQKLYEQAYKELWGEDKTVDYTINKLIAEFGGIRKSDDKVLLYGGATGFEGSGYDGDFMEVTDYKIDGDYLIANVKYLSVVFEKDEIDFYKDIEHKYLIKHDFELQDKITELQEEEIWNYYKKFDDERGTYKLKFKKSSNNKYYWVETDYVG